MYLKKNTYYIDRYDLRTIKECIDTYWTLHDGMAKKRDEIKDMDDEEFKREINKTINYFLYFQKGERYQNKEQTIKEWMKKDKILQDKYDFTPEPKNISCTLCKKPMNSTGKFLEDYTDKPIRMVFFFECSKCNKRKGVYEDGEEKIAKPPTCSKCGKKAKSTHKREGKVITWTTKCLSCGYKEIDVDDFEKSDKERKEREQKDMELLEKYRKEFCFTDEQGKEFIELLEKAEVAKQVKEEAMQKYQGAAFQKVIHLKKIGIVDLEKLLSKKLEKENFIKLELDKPAMGQFIIVPFTVQDANSSRTNYESISILQKIIKTILDKTNWKLVSGSITYRLGYLSGQFKGYERDEDLMRLEYGDKKEERKLSKQDEERRKKYAHDPLVRMAEMQGEYEAIENIRKQRLKKEPDGFFLDANEGVYSCGICGENRPGNEIWWNLDGLRCADCWRNIKEGVIPALKHRFDNKSYIEDWQIRSDYGIHYSSIRKLQRQGILKGRELKRENGSVYCTIYLVEENKEFLKKYPKKPKIQIKYVYSKENKLEK